MRARIALVWMIVSCADAKAPRPTSTPTQTSTPTSTPTSTSTSLSTALSTSTPTSTPTPTSNGGCRSVTSVTVRLDVKKSTASKTFGPRVTVAAATVVGPTGERHDLFAVPEPFHCTFGGPFGAADAGADPFVQMVSCAGDDGYGSARVTSALGAVHVEWRDYGRGLGELDTFDLSLGACERAIVVVPRSLPSSH